MIEIPNFELKEKIGSGANATVYRAIDISLRREVAVKIWNTKGKSRAQTEISKIAQFQNELLVTTHFYGEIDETPFAVMELVKGIDGKKWNSKNNSLNEKIEVWKKYAQALTLLYKENVYHGDPHLGNLLICYDSDKNLSKVKLADTGTSLFWKSHQEFENRDSELILESALKIFKKERIKDLIELKRLYRPYDLLSIISHYIKLLRFLQTEPDSYAYGRNSKMFIEMVLDMPLLNYSEIKKIICENGLTHNRRISFRVNEMVFKSDGKPPENWEQEFMIELKKRKLEFIKKFSL